MNKNITIKKSDTSKPLFSKVDALLIVAFLFIALLLAYVYGVFERFPLRAEITVNGEFYKSVYLADNHEETIVIQTDPVVTLEVSGGGIFFVNALCSDRTCEKSGVLDRAGSTAACLPARVVVTVVSDKPNESVFDAVSY